MSAGRRPPTEDAATVEARKCNLNERVLRSALLGSVMRVIELGPDESEPEGISLKIFVENPDMRSRK
eukprot:scaffold20442_cov40-Phaeocystis_antarctica.AAC.2